MLQLQTFQAKHEKITRLSKLKNANTYNTNNIFSTDFNSFLKVGVDLTHFNRNESNKNYYSDTEIKFKSFKYIEISKCLYNVTNKHML